MSTTTYEYHNICFYGDMEKIYPIIISKYSSLTSPLILFNNLHTAVGIGAIILDAADKLFRAQGIVFSLNNIKSILHTTVQLI